MRRVIPNAVTALLRKGTVVLVLALVGFSVVGCDESPATTPSVPTSTESSGVGTDVTATHVVDGQDHRISPHGKQRSSIPDRIILCDVDYQNDNSGGSGSYTLEVDFLDGEPVRINFENGGWRHVTPREVGETWECSEDGVTYIIHRPPGLVEE
jgi:hypothetical protein